MCRAVERGMLCRARPLQLRADHAAVERLIRAMCLTAAVTCGASCLWAFLFSRSARHGAWPRTSIGGTGGRRPQPPTPSPRTSRCRGLTFTLATSIRRTSTLRNSIATLQGPSVSIRAAHDRCSATETCFCARTGVAIRTAIARAYALAERDVPTRRRVTPISVAWDPHRIYHRRRRYLRCHRFRQSFQAHQTGLLLRHHHL